MDTFASKEETSVSSFHFDIGEKRRSNRLAGRVRRALLRALEEEKADSGLTQQKLAEKLGVHRSVVNRQLTGEANLTLKSLSELLWALNRELHFDVQRLDHDKTSNLSSTNSGGISVLGNQSVPSSTRGGEIALRSQAGDRPTRIRVYEAAV